MAIARELVHRAMEISRQKMDELRVEPANESSSETPDTDSPATTSPGIIQLNNCCY